MKTMQYYLIATQITWTRGPNIVAISVKWFVPCGRDLLKKQLVLLKISPSSSSYMMTVMFYAPVGRDLPFKADCLFLITMHLLLIYFNQQRVNPRGRNIINTWLRWELNNFHRWNHFSKHTRKYWTQQNIEKKKTINQKMLKNIQIKINYESMCKEIIRKLGWAIRWEPYDMSVSYNTIAISIMPIIEPINYRSIIIYQTYLEN